MPRHTDTVQQMGYSYLYKSNFIVVVLSEFSIPKIGNELYNFTFTFKDILEQFWLTEKTPLVAK